MAKRDYLSEAAARPATADATRTAGQGSGDGNLCSSEPSQDRTDCIDQALARWTAWSALTPARRRDAVKAWAAAGEGSRRLLAAALWDEKADVALAAVEALGASDGLAAAATLESLAAITRSARVRASASAAASKIRSRTITSTQSLAARDAEYWASFVDGDGAQLLLSVTPRRKGDRQLATVTVNDRRGLGDAWGAESVSATQLEEIRTEGGRGGEQNRVEGARSADSGPEIGWVRVDAPYCAAALAAALEINRRDRRRLPGCWELYKEAFPEPARGTVTEAEPDPAAAGAWRRQLPRTASLVHFEGFRSWLILGEDVAPFLSAARQAIAGEAMAREELLGEIVSACLATVIRAPQRRLWRSRLLRQAALWQLRGDRVIPDLCRAAAWGLGERSGVPAYEHPLLRAMVRASLEIALGG